jgi:hypothetical protein
MCPAIGAATDEAIFKDVTQQVGLDFIHFNGMSGQHYFPEMTGGGHALFDFDNDGDLDIYLVQGNMLGAGKTLEDALFPPVSAPITDRLFRNDLISNGEASGKLSFQDVTEQSGLQMTGYGMGVTSGDYNNDGWTDLYVTQYGNNHLLRNNGNGSFSDVTGESHSADDQWGTSAAFFDYDRDGWLDLYVANYVKFSIGDNKTCYAQSSRRDYCGPAAFEPLHDRLFHNLGNGKFEEVSDQLLVGYQPGASLGVITADFNQDGWIDIFVANDGQANQMWINQKGEKFINNALFAGTAVNIQGRAEASMGVDAGDFDRDGDADLFLTHLMGETNTLYSNEGRGLFEDRTLFYGLGSNSFPYTTFGTGWLDYDNDGWLDLLVLNGAVLELESLTNKNDPYPLHQPNQLFHNEAGKGFSEVDYAADSPLRDSYVSRGAAFGDVDNDGDLDVLVYNNNGPARLLLNIAKKTRPWMGLRLTGTNSRRDMLGTEIYLAENGKSQQWYRAGTDGSYCSANDPRVLLAYPDEPQGKSLLIRWPDGSQEPRALPPASQYTEIRQTDDSP